MKRITELIGETIDAYEVEALVGRGRLGIVYRARDTHLNRTVALKVLNPMLAHDDVLMQRFWEEARMLGRLRHPHIVEAYAFRQVEDVLFLVMEYVGGGTLAERLQREGPLPWPAVAGLLSQALQGVGFAHAQGTLHHDLRPHNLLLNEEGLVKISDFGLAKLQWTGSASLAVTRSAVSTSMMQYISPEQLGGMSQVDHRSDLYALGMVGYELLAGATPFDHLDSDFAVLKAIEAHDIPPLAEHRPDVPPALSAVLMKALATDPADRYDSAEAMAAALEAALVGAPEVAVPKTTPTVAVDTSATPSPETLVSEYPPAAPPPPPSAPPKPARPVPWRTVFLGGAAVLTALIIWWLWPFGAPPDVAHVSLETTPAGVRVSINGELAGVTPLTDLQVMPGALRLRLEHDGFVPLDTTVAALAGNATQHRFVLRPTFADAPGATTGTLVLDAAPRATVVLDDSVRGETPLTLADVPAGPHTLVLRRGGYEDFTTTITVVPDSAHTVEASLARLQGRLRLIVRPFGDLFVEGTQVAENAFAPVEVERPYGTYRVRAVHPTFGTWVRRVRLGGPAREVLFDFNQEFRLLVLSEPRNAEIVVDGNGTGQYTPGQVMLRPGRHVLAVRKAGYSMAGPALTIDLEADRATPADAVSFTLRSNQ